MHAAKARRTRRKARGGGRPARRVAASLASQKLYLWRLRRHQNKNDAAADLRLVPKYYAEIEAGVRVPGFDYLHKLEAGAGISLSDWRSPPAADLQAEIEALEAESSAAANPN